MKQFTVRLRNYEGNIVDGYIYEAKNKEQAKAMYLERCNRLGIDICKYDYITIEDAE